MNFVYRSVWCDKTGTYVAVSEQAKGRKKASGGSLRVSVVGALLAAGTLLSHHAQADGTGTVIGVCATGTEASNIAIGGQNPVYCTKAAGISSIAIGSSATADGAGSGSTWAGTPSVTGNYDQAAIGVRSSATAIAASAYGRDSHASGMYSTAIGANTASSGNSSVAMGVSSTASGLGAVAIGPASVASAQGALALGGSASASVADGVALGDYSVANRAAGTGGSTLGAVSIGSGGNGVATATRQVVSVARGTQDTDAINLSQLKGVTSALGGGAAVNADGTIAAPSFVLNNANTIVGTTGAAPDVGSGLDKVDAALGTLNTSVAGNTTSISNLTNQLNNGSVGLVQQSAAGANLTVGKDTDGAAVDVKGTAGARKLINVADGAVASGSKDAVNGGQLYNATRFMKVTGSADAVAGSSNSVAIGAAATAVNFAVAVGPLANAAAQDSSALGNSAAALAINATAVGHNATASSGNSTVVGANASATGAFATALGANSVADRDNTVSVGNSSTKRQIVNVAAGTDVNDVVNVSQLTPLVSALGGGATLNSTTGVVTGPSYALSNANSIGGTTGAATDVGSGFGKVDAALGKLNTNVAGNTTSISNLTNQLNNGSVGLVQQSAAGANLTVGKDTDGAAVDVKGTAGARKLINVADGAVAAGSKDAVNGGQLFSTNQQVAQQGTATASALGGTAAYNSTTGAISAPSYALSNANSIGGTTGAATDVGSGFGKVDAALGKLNTSVAGNTTSITNLDGRVSSVEGGISSITNNLNNGSVGLVQQSAAGANLTVGKGIDGAAVDFKGTAGARKLINVADGTVAAGSKDAVNGGQLFATNQQVAQNTTDIGNNTSSITNLDGRVTQNTTSIGSLDYRVTTSEGTISNLSTSVTNLDGRMSNVEGDISTITTNLNNGSVGLVQQSAAGANLTVGKGIDGAAVDFAGTAGARKLINVAGGTVAAGSKDAVNGGQLFGLSQSVAGAMGGGSVVNADGSISAPSYIVTNADGSTSTVSNMGDALSNIDARTVQNRTDITTLNSTIDNLSGVLADAVVYDSSARNKVTFGSVGTPVQLANVKAGELSAQSLDAVNGGQLYATNQQVSQNSADIAGNTSSITNLDGRMGNVEGDISTITSNLNSGTIGLVQQSAAGANLTVGKDTDGAAVDFAGTAGARKLINVADGAVAAGSKDAVNGGQLFGVSQSVADAMGGGSVVNADGSISAPSYTVTNADGSTSTVSNVGDAISNIDARSVQNSTDITTLNSTIDGLSGLMSDAVMYDSAAHDKVTLGSAGKAVQLSNLKAGELSADSSDAVNGAQLFETNNKVAIIDGRVVNLEGSVSSIVNGGGIKYFHTSSGKADSVASGAEAIAVGGNAVASGEGSVALGADAEASAKGSIALGQGASDNGRGAESYTGKYSGADNATVGSVSIGNASTGETRTLANVADGKEATDAVNLRQLDGAVAESKSYTDSKVAGVADGMAASVAQVDTRVSKVEADVSNVQNGTDGMFQVKNNQNLPKPKATGNNAVAGGAGAEATAEDSTAIGSNAKAKGKNSVAIGANSVAERDNSVAVGSAGNERQITHVAAGVERTDAVNVGQVNDALNAMSSESNQRYNDLKHDLSEQDDQLSAGIAGAIAIASLPQPMVNGGSTTAVGVGTYNGQSAVSVGVSHVSNDGKWTTKLGGSTDTQGRFSAGGAVGYNW